MKHVHTKIITSSTVFMFPILKEDPLVDLEWEVGTGRYKNHNEVIEVNAFPDASRLKSGHCFYL